MGGDGDVIVHQWFKHAVLLLFKISAMETIEIGPFEYADKIPLKTDYMARGVRVVPGASARWGSYQAPGVVMMPSYVNIGAYVGENTMVDTWATVGSCAQIGKNVHLTGGVGIGGVLEPPQAAPVIIDDECMIGSRCIVAEGARVGEGTVLGAGRGAHRLDSGDRRRDRRGDLGRGVVPPWSVAVAGTRPRTFPGGRVRPPLRARDQAPRPRASVTTSRRSTTSSATTAPPSDAASAMSGHRPTCSRSPPSWSTSRR